MPSGIYQHKKGRHWKIKDTSNYSKAKKGKQYVLGKHWKIKDTFKMSKATKKRHNHGERFGFQKGQRNENWNGFEKGEKNLMWIDGRSELNNPYSPSWTPELKQSIRQRDKFICAICRCYPAFDVHHKDYEKKNCEPENLVTLCKKCHGKTNYNRNYWIDYFKIYDRIKS